MTREEHLKFCKVCVNQKFDFNQGIICRLTNRHADFEGRCNSFEVDENIRKQLEANVAGNTLLRNTASSGKRLTNYILDSVFFMIFSFIFGLMLGLLLAFTKPDMLSVLTEDNKLVEYLFGLIIGVIYYTFFEATTSRTPAKFITHTRVITEEGERPEFSTIFVRSLCRFIPFDAFSFLGSDSTGWHDKLSKTRVVAG